MAQITRISEQDHPIRSLADWANWAASDHKTFLSTGVALLCLKLRNLGPDLLLYNTLRHLSDAVHWLEYGRITPAIIELATEAVQNFATNALKAFGPKFCTWKFHIFQHMPEFLKRHGALFFLDTVILETMLGDMKRSITTRRNEIKQAVVNFLIKHHLFLHMEANTFRPQVVSFLRNLGLDKSYFTNMTPFAILYLDTDPVSAEEMAKIQEALKETWIPQL